MTNKERFPDGECRVFDCTKKEFKKMKKNKSTPTHAIPTAYCRSHYYQIRYSDPALEKVKKYWIVVAIAIALIGVFTINF